MKKGYCFSNERGMFVARDQAASQYDYNDDAIQVLEGLEAVRKRPGMYIGSTDARGLHHLVYEIVDNSVDEALAGYGDRYYRTNYIKIISISVQDKGRGMPTGMHKTWQTNSRSYFNGSSCWRKVRSRRI